MMMLRHLFLTLIFLLLLLVASPALALTDKDVLLESKAQLIGSCTECLPTWNVNNSLNEFEGITTTTAGTSFSSPPLHVLNITLIRKSLSGTLPSSWSSLTSVTSVDLSYNALTGPLPQEWSALVKMTYFDISTNSLSGSLPSSYSAWTSLNHFDLSLNGIAGFLPPSFKDWKMLSYFDVSYNRLTGILRPEYSQWKNILDFDVGFNELVGELPASYGEWKNMEVFYCGHNQLSGELPDSYGSWDSNVQYFVVDENQFSGSLPLSYSSWVNIQLFSAESAGGLSGTLPESYKTWSQIQFFDVSLNQLSGELPSAYKSWTQISKFGCLNNRFSGSLPPSWSSWIKITNFIASSAGLSGTLPDSYKAWSRLEGFNVNLNQLSGELPSAYKSWTQINFFYVSSNQLTGSLPSEYSAWTKITQFEVNSNRLTGQLPPEYSAWSRIEMFYVDSNQFTGELPSSYSNWNQSLTTFGVNSNFLEGSIPSSYAKLQMASFDVSNNKFNGPIPIFITSWQYTLQFFSISGNQFSGELPIWFSNLSHLIKLDVSNNLLHGTIPSEFCSLEGLAAIDFSQNCLEITSEAIECFSKFKHLAALSYAPSCFSVRPVLTTVPLANSFSYDVVNKLSTSTDDCIFEMYLLENNVGCPGPYQVLFTNTVNGNEKVFQFAVSCGFSGRMPFQTTCYALLFRPLLECFLDKEATIPCTSSTNPVIDFTEPSYHNKTVLPDASVFDGKWTLDISDSKYIYGVYFRIFSLASLNFAMNYTTKDGTPGPLYYRSNTTTPMFQASPCQLDSSVAIQYSTDCTVCPDLALCDGTTVIYVSNQTAAWRYSSDLLPFYECDLKTTKGCLKSNKTNNFDGSSCKNHFTGFLCARCDSDYAMVDGECSQCPSKGSIIGIFCACIVALLIIATLLVYVSLDSVKKEKEEIDKEDECCDCSALEHKLQQYRPQLEKLTVIVRMLINHFTLLGALASTSAANQATDSLKTLLKIQNGGGGGALLGAYSGTLSCLFSNNNQTSSSVLNFNILWIVFASVFVFESIFFFAFTRKLTSTAAVALFLSFVAFSPLAEYSSKLLALCKPFDFYNTRDYLRFGKNANLDQTFSYLSTDLAQECDDDFQSSARVGAALTISLFCGLLPVTIAFAFKKIQSAEDRAAIFNFMTEDYKKEAWYYELIVMVRKLLIALAISIFVEEGDLQLQLFTLITTMMLGASLTIQPLQSKIANIVDQVSISSALVCATFLSVISGFADDEGVAIASTVLIFITQIVAILAIVLFSHRNSIDSSSSSDHYEEEQEVGHLNAPLFSAKDSELATEYDYEDDRHDMSYWKRRAEDADRARIEAETARMELETANVQLEADLQHQIKLQKEAVHSARIELEEKEKKILSLRETLSNEQLSNEQLQKTLASQK